MDDSTDALVYLILGSAGAGRHALADDLIQNGPGPEDDISIASILGTEDTLASLQSPATRYERISAIPPPVPGSTLIIIADGQSNPADQIEAFQQWLKRSRAILARIITVVDCELAQREPSLATWFDCVIHFADCVILSKHEQIDQKWLRAFQERYTKQQLPCLFQTLKKGRARNPALILDPVPRRMSLIFDDIDAIDQLDIDPDNLPEETIDLVAPADPWLERLPSGHHAKPLPDIREKLPQA